MSSAAFLAVGFFALAVWIVRRRHEHLYFLVFAIAALSATRRWHFYAGLEKLHIPDQWFAWLIFNALVWQIVANHSFLVLLHGRSRPWLSRSLIGIAIVVTVMSLPWFSVMTSLVQAKPQPYFGQVTVATILIALNLTDAWRNRSREAWLMVGATLLTVLFGTYDWLNGVYRFSLEGFYLLPYGATALFAAVTYIMFRRYMGAIAEIERVNAGEPVEADLLLLLATLRFRLGPRLESTGIALRWQVKMFPRSIG